MPDQVKSTILAALVTQVTANAPTFGSVTYKPDFNQPTDLATSQWPACVFTVGPGVYNHAITSTTENVFQVLCEILVSPDEDDDVLFNLIEELEGAINTDISLGATCISCLLATAQQPDVWTRQSYKDASVQLAIKYWRDFP